MANNYKVLHALIKKELLLEMRQSQHLVGILLYSAVIVFATKLCIHSTMEPSVWSAILWILMVFSSLASSAKIFISESHHRDLYYYTLVKPVTILHAKTFYNTVILLIANGLSFGLFTLFHSSPIEDYGLFVLVFVLANVGLSSVLTLTSAIAGKAGSGSMMMAVISLPLIVPMLNVSIAATISSFQSNQSYFPLLYLLLLDVIVIMLGTVLFPYIWKE